MRLMITGSRDYAEPPDFIHRFLGEFDGPDIECVIVGDARGPDAVAEHWAKLRGLLVLKFAADWEMHGKAAGPIRNRQMVELGRPDHCVAFWDGRSRGTLNAITECARRGVTVFVVPPVASGVSLSVRKTQ